VCLIAVPTALMRKQTDQMDNTCVKSSGGRFKYEVNWNVSAADAGGAGREESRVMVEANGSALATGSERSAARTDP